MACNEYGKENPPFKKGDRVRITYHPKTKLINKVGTIKDVITVFDNKDLVGSYIGKSTIIKDSTTTGFYNVKIDNESLSGYVRDCDLALE